MRVGANSPSLWPTICSVMKTGTCFRPSWTAIVCPTMSGKTVEERDQVRIICFEPDSFILLMRPSSRSSTKGPFLLDLLNFPSLRSRCESRSVQRRPKAGVCAAWNSSLLLPTAPAADDQLVGFLVLAARALAEGRHAPGRDRVAAALRLALAAAVRVVDRVHRRTSHRRALAPPAAAPRFAAGDVLVV